MKKIFVMFLVVLCLFSLTGCMYSCDSCNKDRIGFGNKINVFGIEMTICNDCKRRLTSAVNAIKSYNK